MTMHHHAQPTGRFRRWALIGRPPTHMAFFPISAFVIIWLFRLGTMACAWFATRQLRNAWLRGAIFSVIVGISTATVAGFMPHSGEVQMAAIFLVIAEAADGAVEWTAARNILLVSLSIWPFAILICRYVERHRKAA